MEAVVQTLFAWVPEIVLITIFGVTVKRDPRRMFPAVLLLILLIWFFSKVVFAIFDRLDHFAGPNVTPIYLISLMGLAVLLMIILGVFLVANSFIMMRRERLNLAALTSGVMGVGIIGLVVTTVMSVIQNNSGLFGWLFLLGLPIGYLAFVFVAYVGYAQIYGWGVRRFAKPPVAVIALGAGLVQGHRVGKLLQSRLDMAYAVQQKMAAAGEQIPLVVSGGKGDDEHRAEAEAMAEYLIGQGVDAENLIQEDQSTTTQENLEFSAQKLAPLGFKGRIRVVTSNFHAFRAATLMRELNMPGHAIGAPTAGYYWPSATVREYMALLRDHLALNVACVIALCIPLLTRIISSLSS